MKVNLSKLLDARLSQLLEEGFDQSYRVGRLSVRVRCSSCEALTINNVATHERGCPRQTFPCDECCFGRTRYRHGGICEGCRQANEEWDQHYEDTDGAL